MSFFRAPPKVPSRADVDACLKVSDNEDSARDHLLIAVAANTGLRVHELVALNWGQVLTDTGAVRHRVALLPADTKGSIGGDIILNESVRWKLTRYKTWCSRRELAVAGDVPLFVSRNHRRLSVRMAQEVWKAVQKRAQLETIHHFHALRHYFGTEIYRATKDIRVTQVLLRHQSVSSTQIYAHVSARDVEAAVEKLT